MNYKKLSVPERLVFTKDAIEVVLENPLLQDAFEEVGYSFNRFSVELGLEEVARSLWIKQQVQYGVRVEATGNVKTKYQEVRSSFGKNRMLARLALKQEPGLWEKLRLSGRVERKIDRLVLQAQHFYTEVTKQKDVRDLISIVSLTDDVLAARLDEVQELNHAMQRQQRQMGHAKATTMLRQKAMADMDVWVVQFLAIARAILKNKPGQLEKIGA